jgi:hypothetical protein
MTRRSTAQVIAAIVAGATLASVDAAGAAVALTKTRARMVAVDAARRTCGVTPWCKTTQVERARACRRASSRTVFCDVRFLTADGRPSAGVVSVSRRGGRLEVGMAVPIEPSASPATSLRSPSRPA